MSILYRLLVEPPQHNNNEGMRASGRNILEVGANEIMHISSTVLRLVLLRQSNKEQGTLRDQGIAEPYYIKMEK